MSDKGITFSPLFKSIEELSKAARKINYQKKVTTVSIIKFENEKIVLSRKVMEVSFSRK